MYHYSKKFIYKILFALITLAFQIPPRSDHKECIDYQNLSCHRYDGNRTKHICNRCIQIVNRPKFYEVAKALEHLSKCRIAVHKMPVLDNECKIEMTL